MAMRENALADATAAEGAAAAELRAAEVERRAAADEAALLVEVLDKAAQDIQQMEALMRAWLADVRGPPKRETSAAERVVQHERMTRKAALVRQRTEMQRRCDFLHAQQAATASREAELSRVLADIRADIAQRKSDVAAALEAAPVLPAIVGRSLGKVAALRGKVAANPERELQRIVQGSKFQLLKAATEQLSNIQREMRALDMASWRAAETARELRSEFDLEVSRMTQVSLTPPIHHVAAVWARRFMYLCRGGKGGATLQ
jgi:hypothetical protein